MHILKCNLFLVNLMSKILVLIYMYIFGYSCDTFVLVDEWNMWRTAFICYLIFGQIINVSTVTFDHCNMSLLNNSSFEYIEKCNAKALLNVQLQLFAMYKYGFHGNNLILWNWFYCGQNNCKCTHKSVSEWTFISHSSINSISLV